MPPSLVNGVVMVSIAGGVGPKSGRMNEPMNSIPAPHEVPALQKKEVVTPFTV
jgi:hypothetical protein